MNKAQAVLDERAELVIPSALITGYAKQTMKVSCHISPDSILEKTELKSYNQQKQDAWMEDSAHCLALLLYHK